MRGKLPVEKKMVKKVQEIHLKPSMTDYATYVARTSRVLRVTGPLLRKTRPSTRLLSLAKVDS